LVSPVIFPDDFIFTGSLSAQHRQVGNAVPPLLAYQIAKELREVLNGRDLEIGKEVS
jgi:DNA (cytosine-5)-methyltransferase 1